MEGPKLSNIICCSGFYRYLQNGTFKENGETDLKHILEVFKA